MTLKVFKGGRQICIHNGAYVLHFQEITSLLNLANPIIPLTASMDTFLSAKYSAISVQTLFKEFITNMNKIISSDRYNFKSV